MAIDIKKENLGRFSAKLDDKSPINEAEKTISFIALSKNNMHKRSSFFGDEYYLSVDTSGVKFDAKTLYLDHEVSFENAIGKIEACKNENGDLKVIVKFNDEVEASREAFARYKAGFSDSVSVGFGDYKIKQLDKIDGLEHYQIYEGTVTELSAVWQGADPNAKTAKFEKEQAKPSGASTQEPKPSKQGENFTGLELASTPAKNAENFAQETKDNDVKNIIALAKITGKESDAQSPEKHIHYDDAYDNQSNPKF
ncbi:MAG: hypothetical protein LUC34_07040, partial [Campylobacter sp.]|nr:hypothetical protein [Campylobacter sp.]